MAKKLENKKIAILAGKGFEQVEYEEPLKALKNEEGETYLIGPEKKLKAWDDGNWGDTYECDVALNDAKAEDYDALFIPGGVMSPDYLRQNDKAVRFVRDFFEQEKPVAAICHG